MLTLDILICTYKPEGINRLSAGELPEIDGVNYVISWQCHEDCPIPAALLREDIKVFRSQSIGLSNNRNEALSHASADVVLIADDDVTFNAQGIKQLMQVYEDNPSIDFITFKSVREGSGVYPQEATRLHRRLPKNYYVASIELSFRRRCNLLFCSEMGLNSPRIHGGEDEMLLQSAIHKNLDCRFYPITITVHNHPSTATKPVLSNSNLRAAGCVIALTYGLGAIFRVPLKAWRVARANQSSLVRAFRYIAQGALEAPGILRRNHESLW